MKGKVTCCRSFALHWKQPSAHVGWHMSFCVETSAAAVVPLLLCTAHVVTRFCHKWDLNSELWNFGVIEFFAEFWMNSAIVILKINSFLIKFLVLMRVDQSFSKFTTSPLSCFFIYKNIQYWMFSYLEIKH